jgi:hypothetical protein
MVAIMIIALLFSVSCQEEKIAPDASVKVGGSQNYILPYDFNWEDPNLNWMPYPANQPKITIPWTGAGSLFGVVSDDVLADRKKADGWRLVYSTFDPNIWNKNPYFMLYNKYRGLIRVYQYVNDIQFAESSYLQDGLYLGNSTFKLLNFAEKEIVDVTAPNTVSVDRVEPKPYNGAPLANNKWYFFQYEIAYDGSITPTLSTSPPQFSFYINSINVSQISLGGTLQASVNGTIGASQTSAGQNVWKAVTGGLKTLGTAGVSAIGVGAINNATIDANAGTNKLGVNTAVWKGVSAGISAALKGATGNIPGAVTGVLSAIFGGSSNSAQTVSLTLNGQLKVDGTQTGTGSLPSTPVSMYIPGSLAKNSSGGYNVQGYVPLYNERLGVFNLTSKPTVTIKTTKTADPYTPGMYSYVTDYSLKAGTFNIQFNPIVNGVDADIVSITPKILATQFQGNIETGIIYMTGSREQLFGATAFTGVAFKSIHRYDYMPPDPSLVLLRVSFVVRPKDGSPDVAIVKTFRVNVERIYP